MVDLTETKITTKYLDNGIVKITFFNSEAKFFKEVYLVKKENLEEKEFKKSYKVQKGYIKGEIINIKNFLITIGLITSMVISGVGIKGIVEEVKNTREINNYAYDHLENHARTMNYNIQLLFLNEVQDKLLARQRENNLTNLDEKLLPFLTEKLRTIAKNQLLYEQALAIDDEKLADKYKNMIKTEVEEATIRCGELGFVIGDLSYYKYLHAIYHNGQVMFLASDINEKDKDLDTRYHISLEINGLRQEYIPTKPSIVEGIKLN